MPSTPQRKDHLDAWAMTLLVVCFVVWALQQILIKITVAEVPPLWQASLRVWGAVLLLCGWCLARGVPLMERDGTLRGGLLAGLLFAGEFVFIYLGLQHTSASRLTVFVYTSPFVVALLLPRVVPSERMRPLQWLGLWVAFLAVTVAFSESFQSTQAPPRQWLGDTMALAAGALWGLTTLAIRATRLSSASAEKTLFYQLGVTAVVVPLLSLALGEPWSLTYSTSAWASIAVQTAIGAFASYLTWFWLLRHYPATQMATFTFLTPLFALVLGVVLLGEPLTWRLVVALLGVAIGMVLVSQPKPGRLQAQSTSP